MHWPSLARRTHKWLALVVAVQAVLWTVSGVYMTAVHIDIIHGDRLVRAETPKPMALEGLVEPASLGPQVRMLKLDTQLGRPVYILETSEGQALVDARTGAKLSPLNQQQAIDRARALFSERGEVVSADLLTKVPLEIQGRRAPVWRIEFEGAWRPTFYISPQTGELLARRHDLWRIFDFVWMLHIMDYDDRNDVDNPLVRVFTWLALATAASGGWLLLYSFKRRRRSPRHVLASGPMGAIRTLHKWLGLPIGLQFLLWALSGAVMALLDADQVSSEGAVLPVAAVEPRPTPAPLSRVAEVAGAPIVKLQLKPLYDDYVYQLDTSDGVQLLDAVSTAPVRIGREKARQLAVAQFSGSDPVRSVERLAHSTLECRDFDPPLWRVEFRDRHRTALFVSEATGEVVGARNETWQIWDVAWMLHIMDYRKRESFNHPIIVSVAMAAAWLALSGLILLFRSFRLADFTPTACCSWTLATTATAITGAPDRGFRARFPPRRQLRSRPARERWRCEDLAGSRQTSPRQAQIDIYRIASVRRGTVSATPVLRSPAGSCLPSIPGRRRPRSRRK